MPAAIAVAAALATTVAGACTLGGSHAASKVSLSTALASQSCSKALRCGGGIAGVATTGALNKGAGDMYIIAPS